VGIFEDTWTIVWICIGIAVLALAIWAAAINAYRQIKARQYVEEYIKSSRANNELFARLFELTQQQVRAAETGKMKSFACCIN